MELTKFSSEIELLKNNLVFNQANKLRQLKPYVDQEGNCQNSSRCKTSDYPPKNSSNIKTNNKERAQQWTHVNTTCSSKPQKEVLVSRLESGGKKSMKDVSPPQKDESKKHLTIYE